MSNCGYVYSDGLYTNDDTKYEGKQPLYEGPIKADLASKIEDALGDFFAKIFPFLD
ncbi:MAG: hypothetical protein AABX93_01580 [Nanoarchaeota archaeon]